MKDLVFAGDGFEQLRDNLLRHEAESCAVIFVNPVVSDQHVRLLVTQIQQAPAQSYERRTETFAQLQP